ncbi:hypothetical protein A2311_02585 [candidate division WOR-1 bacterium RIFOXYB2_FULL_48_7]|uniref:Radical SAM core domain-containing protein n=1 Tax=candidate division WOR-1 bacterium RIFOXYB2_FULL_48_7 TaxID=1802583 RepID=A0A1F4TRI4_UNCSA|nr:MAG: hypothetical protein A2311_02585 [candidate division WOR-1 bacterium RIFOXYB2_FULL_48_7]
MKSTYNKVMDDLRGKSLKELLNIFAQLQLPQYKAKETFRQIHHGLKGTIDQISILKKEERALLAEKYQLDQPQVIKHQHEGETEKIAFKLSDNLVIESVLMQYEGERNTVCVSSQVGCPVACQFCATGQMGFKRNLTVGEILSQIYYFATKHKISNVVFMGMGEPLLNYKNVMKAIGILNQELGQNIAKRKIVISTIGITEGIKKLMTETGQLRLAWSLVASFDHLRKELIGMKNLPSISSIVRAIHDYQQKTKRRVTIEYVLLKGINDGPEAINELAEITRKIDSHVNIIPYNEVAGGRFSSGDAERIYEKLKRRRVNVTTRQSLGKKISAACGQLTTK